jgi:D-arabinose 1-dehydrogenase-like Zn-dependent alcohol dehydrogenase
MEKKRALRLADMPHPELRDDEVLVEVHAAGVNLLDSKLRDGEFKLILPYRLPLILGHDVAGVVVRSARRVRELVSHPQTECMGAIYSCEIKAEESLCNRGRPCMLPICCGGAAKLELLRRRQSNEASNTQHLV